MRWLVLLALLPGCVLYGADDDVLECADGEFVPDERVDPGNLTCQDFGSYVCAPQDDLADLAVPIPSWGSCDSPCRALDEGACYGASGCRLVYDYACYTGDGVCSALVPFLGCYPVDQSGPVQGACENLGAWDCSLHDDCVALHDAASLAFVSCGPEGR